MKNTTGALALWAAVGADFMPIISYGPDGVEQGDGSYVTVLAHPDGRTIALRTERGDGWQHGPLMSAVAGGPWRLPKLVRRRAEDWKRVRTWLNLHDPGREEPYCGGAPVTQPRELDGRERDILCRILRDIENALREGGDRQEQLLWSVHIDQEEVNRLLEMRAILDPRDD